jgi:hypothetical protein
VEKKKSDEIGFKGPVILPFACGDFDSGLSDILRCWLNEFGAAFRVPKTGVSPRFS